MIEQKLAAESVLTILEVDVVHTQEIRETLIRELSE
jgi:hypothetical protein